MRGKYLIEDHESRGKETAVAVQSEREALRRQNADPDKAFTQRRQEYAEAVSGALKVEHALS